MRNILVGKRYFLVSLFIILLVFQASILVMANENTNAPVLKIDREDVLQLPRNFRMGTDSFQRTLKDGTVPSRIGMDKLRVSGSSIFSELEFTKMLDTLPVQSKDVIVVDLRQESHGYINGTAVSWFAANNWGNDGKTLDGVVKIERALLDQTLADSPVNIYNFDDEKNVTTTSKKMIVDSARTEEEMVRSHGAGYYRLALSDHFRPEDKDVDEFVKFYKQLPRNAWLHFHCFAGEGRTSIFLAMYDILANAKKVSFDDIVGRQGLIGPVDLRNIPASKMNWKRKAYIERLQFVKHFYTYVKESPADFLISYSEWAKKHDY
ncbi:MAG: hypothetical protein H6Q72_4669 [Firmicutes bacterium]|nr:hypothetical protein [Bacillota bacterium]